MPEPIEIEPNKLIVITGEQYRRCPYCSIWACFIDDVPEPWVCHGCGQMVIEGTDG